MKFGQQFSRLLTVSMLGFFALIAQTLLFRDFLSIYAGSELGIGVFFSSWLVWVALGALTARKIRQTQNVDLLFLLYLPAFILQQFLILHSRELAGIKAYELFPFIRMLPVSFVANAPVSFVTGLLFPLACRWFESEEKDIPVSRVYAGEALGSFLGGAVVTIMLATGLTSEAIFLSAALVLAVAVMLSSKRRMAALAVVCLLVALGFSNVWSKQNNRAAWARLLPVEQYAGAFATTHARYLYGAHRGQFNVVSFESVTESVPQSEYASALAALHLAQKPDAGSVLVAGHDSYALCRRLAEFPTLGKIVWLHPDIGYPSRLLSVLPLELRTGLGKLEMPAEDIRDYLQNGQKFDLIILNLPAAATLSINRYFTKEFFLLVRDALTPGGVVGVKVSGGENFMSGELLRIGASVFQTLESVFSSIGIKPGDATWLLASNRVNVLTQDAAELVSRFASVAGAATLYPPEGLRSLYPADRAEFQLNAYHGIADENLVNRDRHPLALFHTLLLAGKQGGAGDKTVRTIVSFSRNGFIPVLSLILLYGLLRAVYLRRPAPNAVNFDSGFLVASAGGCGLALNVVLMFLFQSRFGSIFLYIGLMSSLFMAGLFCGALLARWKQILAVTLPLHGLCVVSLILLPAGLPMAGYFALLFVFGIFSGTYIPAVSVMLGQSALHAGSTVEMCDHFGGALGALLVGILLLPVFGISRTLVLIASLLAVNSIPITGRFCRERLSHWIQSEAGPKRRQRSGERNVLRTAGYILFGFALFALVIYHTSPHITGDFEDAARILKLQSDAQVFDSRNYAPGVYGYGGPLSMAVAIDKTGTLLDFKIYKHRETPSYLRITEPWMTRLIGLNLFGDDTQRIDGVSGATVTCHAVKQTLVSGAMAYAEKELGHKPGQDVPMEKMDGVNAGLISFLLLGLAAILLRQGSVTRLMRRLFLIVVVLVAGLHLNMQYSTDSLLRLLALELPPLQSIVPFMLTGAVPILVLLFGNVYCGWICPFGALQELAGSCIDQTPDKAAWRYARFIKYILLFVLVLVFGLGGGRAILTGDPLTSFFSSAPGVAACCFAAAAVVFSIWFGRFWCRNLCPAGAFLTLLSRVRLLKRWIPKVRFARCDYGVLHPDDLDCICCDRCNFSRVERIDSENGVPPSVWSWFTIRRHVSARCAHSVRLGDAHVLPNRCQHQTEEGIAPSKIRETILVCAVIAVAVLWLGHLRYVQEEAENPMRVSNVLRGSGVARNVDMNALRAKIRRGELSDHEALFYQKVEGSGLSGRRR